MDSTFDFTNTGKYNNSLSLSDNDKKNGTKIYCKEKYAQELYNLITSHDGITEYSKDLVKDNIYSVIAKTLSYDNKEIYTEEVVSKNTILVPFKEYSGDVSELVENEESRKFSINLYKSSKSGEYYGSEKKARSVTYLHELFNNNLNNKWFSVEIVSLVKGGFIALYKNKIKCFIPGSHAAANVIRDFDALLGKTLNVMVDNYDKINNLFIVSYKKYIKHSMPILISELNFGTEYTGKLTTNPYDFGIFVEFDDYYTGLIHKSEFKNYNKAKRELRAGDEISVYVKDVSIKKNQYRIVLTLDKHNINDERLQWQSLRDRTENQSFRYNINKRKNSISIEIDGDSFEVSIRRKDLNKNLNRYPYVKVFKVDPINKRLSFEFIKKTK
jgi:ribosomal protein S1